MRASIALVVVAMLCATARAEVKAWVDHYDVQGKPCAFYCMQSGETKHFVRFYQNRVGLRPNGANWEGGESFLAVRYGKQDLLPCDATIRFADESEKRAVVEVVWKTAAGPLTARFEMRDGRDSLFVSMELPPGKDRVVQLMAYPSSYGGGWQQGMALRKRQMVTPSGVDAWVGPRDVVKTLGAAEPWFLWQDDHFDVAKTRNKDEGPCAFLYNPADAVRVDAQLANYASFVKLYPKGEDKTSLRFALWDFMGQTNEAAAARMKTVTPDWLDVGPAPLPPAAFKPTRPVWTAAMPVQAQPKPFVPRRTLFVSPFGDDKNDGLSLGKASKTISRAAKATEPGDLVLVKSGEYFEHAHLMRPGTAEAPIVFRAAPGETAIITAGHRVEGWARVEGTRFCWSAPYARAVNMVTDGMTLARYATVHDMKTLDEMPSSFYFDAKAKRIHVHCYEGLAPEQTDVRVIDLTQPSGVGAPAGATGYAFDKGFWPRAPWNRVEGFFIEFQPIGVQLRANDCEVWNVTAYGCADGVTAYEGKGLTIANCRAYLNDGSGVHISSAAEGARIVGNLTMLNTHRGPLEHSGSGGHPHDMALYGGVPDPTYLGNVAVSFVPSRAWRFKAAKGRVDVRRNVVYGGNAYVDYGSEAVYEANAAFGGAWRLRDEPGEVAPDNTLGKARVAGNVYVKSMAEALDCGLADPGRNDFRPREDFKFLGQGPWPKPAPLRYVSPHGADDKDGRTPDKAWKSLAKAAAAVAAGETVYVLPGVYREDVSVTVKAAAESPARILTWGRGKVVIDGAVAIRKASGVVFDGFNVTGGVVVEDSRDITLNENVVDTRQTAVSVSRSAGVVLENETLVGAAVAVKLAAPAGRMTLRNCLFHGVGQALAADKADQAQVLSERNGFGGARAAEQLKAWQAAFAEGLPSLAGEAPLDEEYRLPRHHAFTFSGIGARPIGARAAPASRDAVVVEDFIVASAMPTEAIVTWSTPFEYADARVQWIVKGGKSGSVNVTQDVQSKTTRMSAVLTNLTPGAEVVARLSVKTPDGRTGKAERVFGAPDKVREPTTLYVGTNGDDKNNGLSPDKSLRTLTAAGHALRPGDTLVVGPGVYPETLQVRVGGLSDQKPLVIRASEPGQSIIDCGELRSNAIQIANVKHVALSGFRIRGMVYSASRCAVQADKVQGLSVERFIFEPRQTGSKSCSQQLLFMTNCKGVTIRDSLFYSGFTTIWGTGCDNVTVDHNTFFCAGINAIYLGGDEKAAFTVTNNIFEDITSPAKRHAAVKIEHMNASVKCDHNLHFLRECKDQHVFGAGHPFRHTLDQDARTLKDAQQRYGVEKNGRFGDPKFRDPLKGDFRLGEGSAGADMASDGGAVGMRPPCEKFSR